MPRPAAEPGRGGELADQEVFLGAEPASPLGVVPFFGLGEFLVEVGQALPVGGSGLPVENVAGGGSGRIVQAVGWCRGAGQAGAGAGRAGGEPDQFHRGQLAAGVTDEQVQVPQAQAVRHPGAGVRVADEPEIVLPVQGEGAPGLIRLVLLV